MKTWQETTLGKSCDIYQPKTISAADLVDDGEYPVYGANGIIGRYDKFNHSESQLLITCRGATCGSVNVSLPNSWINGNAMVVRPRDNSIELKYLEHLFRGGLDLSSVITGAAQPQITRQSLAPLSFSYPPLPEQRRIAAILDQADALRAKRREALAQLDKLEGSIFLEFRNQTKKESIEIPLVDLSEKNRGSFVNGPFGSDLLTSELQDAGVPVIYIRDIRNGDYQRVSKVCVSEKKAKDLDVCSVKPSDILVAKVGDPPGIAAVYPDSEPLAVITQDVIRIRPNLAVVAPEFIKAYLNSSVGRWKIAGITVEATRARFSLGDFKKLAIEIPPLASQNEFVTQIKAVKKLRSFHKAALAELDYLFISLQHRAFRGDL